MYLYGVDASSRSVCEYTIMIAVIMLVILAVAFLFMNFVNHARSVDMFFTPLPLPLKITT